MNGIPRLTCFPVLSLRLLGDFRLLLDETPVMGMEGVRLQSLLAYLVLHQNIPQSRTRLVSLLWPDSTKAQAHTNLRNRKRCMQDNPDDRHYGGLLSGKEVRQDLSLPT